MVAQDAGLLPSEATAPAPTGGRGERDVDIAPSPAPLVCCKKGGGTSIAAIAGGIAGGLLALAALIIAIALYVRHHSRKAPPAVAELEGTLYGSAGKQSMAPSQPPTSYYGSAPGPGSHAQSARVRSHGTHAHALAPRMGALLADVGCMPPTMSCMSGAVISCSILK
jgi:hypothetical protein